MCPVRASADPERVAFPPIFLVAIGRFHVVALVHRMSDSLAGLYVVERWVKVVEAEDGAGLDRPHFADDDAAVVRDGRNHIQRRAIQEVDLAPAQRGEGGAGVGNDR